ncbi:hypothetical protein GCM10010327_53270 [Streptomyces nitrosporeus]|nr:hypothetical protein GCM10010327_53270 [Streptomyces nitrosporeus]
MVRTAVKNQPSKRASFDRTARTQRSVSVCMVQASGTAPVPGWRKSDISPRPAPASWVRSGLRGPPGLRSRLGLRGCAVPGSAGHGVYGTGCAVPEGCGRAVSAVHARWSPEG